MDLDMKRTPAGGAFTVKLGDYGDRGPNSRGQGHVDDAQIQLQRGIVDVPLIVRILFLDAQGMAAVDLSPAG
jgi:hypothetical protein